MTLDCSGDPLHLFNPAADRPVVPALQKTLGIISGVGEYIRSQEDKDKRLDQLTLLAEG